MTVTHKQFDIDGLLGRVYDFTEVGDGIPRHIHGRRDSHLTIVTNGIFMMHAANQKPMLAGPGHVVNYPPGLEHWSTVVELPPDRPARMVFIFRFFLPPSALDALRQDAMAE